ncbi:hypothetical protein H8356DRAFT_1749817 [Neocallimastix lanati (nom. inval.)]|nr:hypothetical protein H8356DRAFT_1749817 [Neocallimastix sp. JGI-2020a]
MKDKIYYLFLLMYDKFLLIQIKICFFPFSFHFFFFFFFSFFFYYLFIYLLFICIIFKLLIIEFNKN